MPSSQSSPLRLLLNPCLKLGSILGICLAGTAVAWVLVANRAPSLDRFAPERSLGAALIIGALMLMPLFRFLKSPARIFVAGVIAWTILTGAYRAMEIAFPRLNQRLGAFHLFMLGAVLFGLLAAFVWMTRLVLHVRHHAISVAPRRLP